MRLMAYLLVPVSFSVPENQPHRKRFPRISLQQEPDELGPPWVRAANGRA
jgi:hypothetical protein